VTIYLIRHAQSAFNAVYDPNKPDPMIFDAPITALGETQAQQARSEVKQLDLTNVIVSPFTRTLQTPKSFLEIGYRFRLILKCESNFAIAVM